ncbi:hypothetical protein ACFLQL_00510 [Verrucomicrobiota bacterium]
MGFNDRVQKTNSESMTSSIFKNGVKFKSMSGKGAIIFRIMPAYNMEDKDPNNPEYLNPLGFLPFRSSNGELSEWGNLVYLVRYAGHGLNYKTGRRDLVSLKTFDTSDDSYCPYDDLYRRAVQDRDWAYLTQDTKDATGQISERACLPRTQRNLVLNIVDINDSDKGIMVGLFSTSAYYAILSDTGLASQSASNVTEEQIKQNYLMQWACGDLTDPTNGPVLVCTKGTDKGEKSGYKVQLALDMNNRVRRWPIKPLDLLANRYNMSDLESFINKMTNEEMIKTFVDILTGRSPTGIHERAFLNEVFGNLYGNLIPAAPAAPAAGSTVQGGFGPNPAQSVKAPAAQVAAPKAAAPTGAPAPAAAAPAAAAPAAAEAPKPDGLNMEPSPLDKDTPVPTGVPGGRVKFDRGAFMKKISNTPR